MANKVFFEKETEKPIDEQFVKHVPFAVTTRMLRSAANNGGLRDGEFYDDFFMHIGTSSSNTRFYNALRYIASHGYKPTKDFKKLFESVASSALQLIIFNADVRSAFETVW